MSKERFPVLVLTGLSGAGKSTALKVFEDLGFFCVDGLPVSMLSRLISLFKLENPKDYRGLALGMDIRQHELLQDWQQALLWLEQEGLEAEVIFLEAEKEELFRRYATTRRLHPLESQEVGLEMALETEQELLLPIRQQASLVLDTTSFSVHDLRRELQRKWEDAGEACLSLRVRVISFGYKYGMPKEADLVFDLRFLPNPYFVPEYKGCSGQDPQVAQYVLGQELGTRFWERFQDFLLYVLPLYAQEGRYRLNLALGCTGGRHRSVAVAEKLWLSLQEKGYQASLEHRHLELG
ncbi:MAG: RNase adapter RapZ [Thermodesulfobacteriota bacterium]